MPHQDPGGFLERGRRDKGIGTKRRLCDAEQHRSESRGGFSSASSASFSSSTPNVDLIRLKIARISGLDNPDPSEHLPDDDLNMLIVDLDALKSIHILDLTDDVVSRTRPLSSSTSTAASGPSTITSPFSTVSPSNTLICRSWEWTSHAVRPLHP